MVSVHCDREGRVRAVWCALTRKYGGTARGSHSWDWRQLLEPELLESRMLRVCLAVINVERYRKTLRCCVDFHDTVIVGTAVASRVHTSLEFPDRLGSVKKESMADNMKPGSSKSQTYELYPLGRIFCRV